MAKHIGIVAVSSEGAALCYSEICRYASARMGLHQHPEISLHALPFSEYAACAANNDWEGTADLMLQSAHHLAGAGAEFLICPANTPHAAFPFLEDCSPLPWLNIADVVATEAQAQGYYQIGVLGTRYLMEGPVYREILGARGLGMTIPDDHDRERLNSIIYNELVQGTFCDISKRFIQKVVEKFQVQGCDSVVLGCTEIPLIVSASDLCLPVLDSTRLLAHAAVEEALRE